MIALQSSDYRASDASSWMVLNLEKITGPGLRVLPNGNSVAGLQSFDSEEIVRVGKLGSSARAGIGFNHGSSRTAILQHLESPALHGEEWEPVLQDEYVPALFLFRCDPLRVHILHSQRVNPSWQRLAADQFRPEEPSPESVSPWAWPDSFSTPSR